MPKKITSRTVWNVLRMVWDVGLESRKLAVLVEKLSIMWFNITMLCPLIHKMIDIFTFTGNSRFKHPIRGYFESPMKKIFLFNIGKQATLDKHGYRMIRNWIK